MGGCLVISSHLSAQFSPHFFCFFLGGWMATKKIKIQWNQWVHDLYSFCMIVYNYITHTVNLFMYTAVYTSISIYIYNHNQRKKHRSNNLFWCKKNVGHSGLGSQMQLLGEVLLWSWRIRIMMVRISRSPRGRISTSFARHGNFHNRKKIEISTRCSAKMWDFLRARNLYDVSCNNCLLGLFFGIMCWINYCNCKLVVWVGGLEF